MAATSIADCQIYDSATTCKKCLKNAVLSIDRSECNSTSTATSHMTPNCGDSQWKSTPSCSMCSMGHFFKSDGSCTACTNNTLSQGCG
ncbi:MAG: hypothetical protein GY938_12655 [Ketobacter sp.]|nr:hypothetical protein [Ketobacter sp.]